jgi:hypothetical protein
MNTEQLNQALYDKMAEEQQQYRTWLVGLPQEEILDHACEYSTREDILVEMESVELSPAQAKALLKSRSPLADVYKEWQNTETHHMGDIHDVLESRADYAVKAAKEQAKDLER